MQTGFGILALGLISGPGATSSGQPPGEGPKAPATIRADEVGRTVWAGTAT
jgi:hypothetical protein